MGNIHRLIELNAGHREQKRKSPNSKSDIGHNCITRENSSHYVKSLHTGIKGNEAADKVAKQAINITHNHNKTLYRLLPDHQEGKWQNSTSKLHY